MLRKAYEASGYCIKCGFCEPVCPTIPAFRNSPLYGPRGRILLLREIMSARTERSKKVMNTFFSCISCDACGDVCPAGVNVGEVSRLMREEALYGGEAPDLVYTMREAFLRRGNPLGVDPPKWRPANLPGKGKYLLFTGGLYQLMAYAGPIVSLLERFKERPGLIQLSLKTGIARLLLRLKVDDSYIRVLDDIADLLVGYEVYYRPELDLYSGVLIHDLGMEEEFAEHANRVGRMLKGRKIVVLDPHTAYALSELYPKYVDGFDADILYYFDLLKGKFRFKGRVAFQEPCYLLRHFRKEGIRPILESIEGIEPENTKASCCGGPIEFLFGREARKVAERRVKELGKNKPDRIVTACPVCMASFKRAGIKPTDLSTLLKLSIKSTY